MDVAGLKDKEKDIQKKIVYECKFYQVWQMHKSIIGNWKIPQQNSSLLNLNVLSECLNLKVVCHENRQLIPHWVAGMINDVAESHNNVNKRAIVHNKGARPRHFPDIIV